jgi:hypothetical protein
MGALGWEEDLEACAGYGWLGGLTLEGSDKRLVNW